MDQALTNALTRIEALNRRTSEISSEIERLNCEQKSVYEELDKLQDFIKIWHELADVPAPSLDGRFVPLPKEGRKSYRGKNPPRELVVEKSLNIIHERGMPVARQDLYDELASQGLVIQGKDPLNTLHTMIWRSPDKLQYIKSVGYWVAGEPYKPLPKTGDTGDGRFDL